MPKLFLMQRPAFYVLIISLATSSCGNIKGLQYVQGDLDSVSLRNIQFKEPVIQRGDMMSITVFSADPSATAAVTNQMPVQTTLSGTGAAGMGAPAASPSYLVDQKGNIELFRIGDIHVEGMTKKQLGDTIAARYEQAGLLKDPFAEVRFLNHRVTLVGEVNRPGVYNIPAEKVSIFEAVGLAGDITNFGRRDNVLVVREANGVREFARLDLSRPDVFTSPYFYLQQNDMVIVDVRKNKSNVNDQITVRNITIAASVLSTIAIFINIFRR